MAKKTFTEGDEVIVKNPWTGDKTKAVVISVIPPGTFSKGYGGEVEVRFHSSSTTARLKTEDWWEAPDGNVRDGSKERPYFELSEGDHVLSIVPFCDVDKDQIIEDEHMRQGSL